MSQGAGAATAVGLLSIFLWLLTLALFLIPLWRMAYSQKKMAEQLKYLEFYQAKMANNLEIISTAAQAMVSVQKSRGNGPGGQSS